MLCRGVTWGMAAALGVVAWGQQPGEQITIEHRGPLTIQFRKSIEAGPLAHHMVPYLFRVREHAVRVVSDNPLVTWGVDSLTADTIEFDDGYTRVDARGHIVLTDPIGTLKANELHFNYETGRGWARGASVSAQGAYFTAETIEINQGVWYAYEGTASTCDLPHQHYALAYDKVVLRPGVRAKVYKPGLILFGHPLFGLPSFTMSLKKARNQISLPTVGYSKRQGFSLGWHDLFDLSPRLSLVTQIGAFEKAVPERRELLSYSILPPADDVIATPDAEEGERFTYSYIDNVNVPNPADEDFVLSAKRNVFFFENSSNLPATSRLAPDLFVTKDYEFGWQGNTQFGPLFGTLSVRSGRILESPGARTGNREAVQAVGSFGSIWLTRNVAVRLRGDAALFRYRGEDNYGWVRPAAELMFEPSEQFRLVLAYIRTFDGGTPFFLFDKPTHTRTFNARVDFSIGFSRISVLTKYDFTLDDLYDIEISFRYRLHCVEPSFTWRKDPGEFRIGLHFPAVDILKVLTAQRVKR